MPFLDDLWSNVLKNLRATYAEAFIELWFNDMKLVLLNNSYAVLVNTSDLKARILTEKHLPAVKESLEELIGYSVKLVVLSSQNGDPDLTPYQEGGLSPSSPAAEETDVTEKEEEDNEAEDDPFEQASAIFPADHTKYTFDNFIVGTSNKFAYEACIAVCNEPATQFNPLFIYGESGLGKTHLLYAINNQILSKNPNANIIYVRGEDFANQLIKNITSKSPVSFREKFRNKFRKTDILLIDDIHFIAGKESTQEEVFHTFNALYEAGKQIILTSDRPPKEIKTLEERLRTRFEGGLIVDIVPPDYELRIAIIKHKAKKLGITLEPEVMDYIADNMKNNIRQLEGAVKTLAARSFLNGSVVSLEMAKECLANMITNFEPVNVTLDRIFDKVTKRYPVSEADLKGTKRNQEVAEARHICIYIIKNMTDLSLKKIGVLFSRDHTTVMSSLKKTEKSIKEDSLLEIEIKNLMEDIAKGKN